MPYVSRATLSRIAIPVALVVIVMVVIVSMSWKTNWPLARQGFVLPHGNKHLEYYLALYYERPLPQESPVPTVTGSSGSRSVAQQELQDPLSAQRLRKLNGDLPGRFLGTGRIYPLLSTMTLKEAEQRTAKEMMKIEINCDNIQRFGNEGDGGYDVCVSPPFNLKKGDCLVYSFGISNNWNFDEAANDQYACDVHSFDPSIKKEDHMHREPNMFFHNLGLSGSNTVNTYGWKLRDLATIIKDLGHSKRAIDVLKIDVEGSEWPALRSIIDTGVHKQVRQLMFEAHSPRLLSLRETMSVLDHAQIYSILHDLERLGFTKFTYQAVNDCCAAFPTLVSKGYFTKAMCCYEVYYVNTQFVAPGTHPMVLTSVMDVASRCRSTFKTTSRENPLVRIPMRRQMKKWKIMKDYDAIGAASDDSYRSTFDGLSTLFHRNILTQLDASTLVA